jgi:hypothetical protein
MSCAKNMTFQECELTILRGAVDKIDKKIGKSKLSDPNVAKIISIVEAFLKKKKLVCYGGTAINNILPTEDQFYDKTIELPDYDFFSPKPLEHARELADIYFKEGFEEVEAKSGVHAGTFKVFVNYIPVADITYIVPELYKKVKSTAVKVDGILYSPPNYLRMLMFLELSRPNGDVSRWEKVLKRITVLNKNYPLKVNNCNVEDIQRLFESNTIDPKTKKVNKNFQFRLFELVRDNLIKQNVIFFGAYANRMYLKNLPNLRNKKIPKIPDFDVLSENPKQTAENLKNFLTDNNIQNVKVVTRKGVGEVIAPHYQISVNEEILAYVYEPLACHSYNVIRVKNKKMRVATIDTMLSFYLAFVYVDRAYYDPQRILCMAQYLFQVQQKNRLKQKGILRRFSIDCYGKQLMIEDMRKEKSDKYEELKGDRGSKEWNWYFLKYRPVDEPKKSKKNKNKNKKTKKRKKNGKRKTKKRKSSKTTLLKKIFNF